MKHRTARIISGTLGTIENWVRQKPLLALLLALLLIKLLPIIAMVLFVAIGIAVFRAAQQPAHLSIEVNPV
jgi:hypothetical protein